MRNFGPYETLEQVATGATGILYRARHSEIGRVVAIKELASALLAVPGLLDRFRSEARVLAGLDDPHVVAIYDFVEEPDRAWIAEEWVPGASLREIVASQSRLAPEQALGAVRGALMGLAYAHARGLVHRDIAPGNVLADMAGESKLVDFGLAAPVGETGVMGTPAFMSPEAVRGEALSTASDVYSAGGVLYLLLAGRPPFPATSAAEALRRQLDDAPPKLTGHGTQLGALVARCLAKEPDDRPADAAALLAELEEAAARKYGAAWLTKASIAGLVAATALSKGGGGVTPPEAASQTSAQVDTGRATVRRPPPSRAPVLAPTPAAAKAAEPVVVAPAAVATEAPHHRSRRGRRLTRRASPVVVAAAATVVLAGAAVAAATVVSGGKGTPTTKATAVAVASAAPLATEPPAPSATPAPPSPAPAPLLAAAAPQGRFAIAVTVVKSTNAFEPAGTVLRGTWTVVTTCADTAHATIKGVRPPVFTFGKSCTGTVTSTSGARYGSTWDGTTLVTKGTRESPCLNRGTPVPGTAGAYHEEIVNTLKVTKRATDGRPAEMRGTGEQTQTLVKGFPNCRAGTTAESRTLVITLV